MLFINDGGCKTSYTQAHTSIWYQVDFLRLVLYFLHRVEYYLKVFLIQYLYILKLYEVKVVIQIANDRGLCFS